MSLLDSTWIFPDRSTARHPAGRKAFFVGDLVDRGPDSPGVLRLAMGMVRDGTAACIPGNHENKLWRALNGRNVLVSHGLAETLAQLDAEPDEFRTEVATFIDSLMSHAVLDDGRCVVAHAGLPERFHNRSSGAVRSFALYGDTTGETDEFGLPVRYPWANDYRGSAIVVRREWLMGGFLVGHLLVLSRTDSGALGAAVSTLDACATPWGGATSSRSFFTAAS